MKMPPLAYIRRAMENARGDDLQRARIAFRGMTSDEMQQEHGHSGQTRQQILDDYQEADAEWQAADAYLRENLKGYRK